MSLGLYINLPVSHICTFTLTPFFSLITLVPNSTAIVGLIFSLKIPLAYLNYFYIYFDKRLLLPTFVSPTRITTIDYLIINNIIYLLLKVC